ncbi:unnamed protein product [Brachionus calyciflorus]|uniref:Neurotransmitter-gated ion-channel ligand-binding domain-containing protein n=1 Tax=Brachionus calyciflorus TaxID=104777 RepID=A0A814B9N5_9BILA|nr:unnamed protein product [Brachionus calyciflorus]
MSKIQRQYKVETHVIIQKIGQINTKNETFYAEFFIETQWSDRIRINEKQFKYDPAKFFNPNIILNNSVGDPYQEISYSAKILENGKVFKLVEIVERRKIQGKFWQKFDFNKFPLDVQTLAIEISSSSPCSQVHLIESKNKFNFLNPNAFMDTQEWKICNHIQTRECLKQSEVSTDENSAFTIQISAFRMPSYYLYNAFLLIFIITSVGLAKFTIQCDTPHVRLIVDTTVVLTLITFKWVIAEEIPQISYLTSLDKYNLFSIAYVIAQSIYDSVVGVLASPKCAKPYGTYDLYAFIASVSLLAIVNIFLVIWIIFIAIRNRYDMYKYTKVSSDTNSKRLLQMYNKDMSKFESNLDVKNDFGEMDEDQDENDSDKKSDTDSIGSQTIRL